MISEAAGGLKVRYCPAVEDTDSPLYTRLCGESWVIMMNNISLGLKLMILFIMDSSSNFVID